MPLVVDVEYLLNLPTARLQRYTYHCIVSCWKSCIESRENMPTWIGLSTFITITVSVKPVTRMVANCGLPARVPLRPSRGNTGSFPVAWGRARSLRGAEAILIVGNPVRTARDDACHGPRRTPRLRKTTLNEPCRALFVMCIQPCATQAYKDLDQVMQQQESLTEIVCKLMPLINVKGFETKIPKKYRKKKK